MRPPHLLAKATEKTTLIRPPEVASLFPLPEEVRPKLKGGSDLVFKKIEYKAYKIMFLLSKKLK
jgi:hypothetical protein